MAIPITKYVDIKSYATGGAVVSRKMTIGRILTENVLAPMGKVIEFTSANNVRSYFGSQSDEYKFAQSYFNWISKKKKRAKRLSFARYTVEGQPVIPAMVTAQSNFSISALNLITDGTLTLNYTDPDLGFITHTFTEIDFSGTSSLAEVAQTLQDEVSNEPKFADVSVIFTTAYNGGRFMLEFAGTYGSFAYASGSVAEALGLDIAGAPILSDGNEGIGDMADEMERIMDADDNCYTFRFMTPQGQPVYETVAAWNHERNCDFMFIVEAQSLNEALTLSSALAPYDMAFIQLDSKGEMQSYAPMAALACVDYTQEHAAINFMYQPFPNNTPNVTDKVTADRLDAVNVNYIGKTGKNIDPFLQDGMLTGTIPDATIGANAIWLKDEIIVTVMSLFMRADAIYANDADMAKIAAVCNNVWSQGLTNGSILSGKILTDDEKATVEALTGDAMAWARIEKQGFIFEYSIYTATENKGKKYFKYRLIYGATDTIRKVEGDNIALTTTA